jgi:UDP-N-acetylglucosamine transferase subunit ALG13
MSELERIGFLASAQEEAVIVLPWKNEYNELVDSDHFVEVSDMAAKSAKPFCCW